MLKKNALQHLKLRKLKFGIRKIGCLMSWRQFYVEFFRGNVNFKIMKCEDLLYVVRFQYVWLIVVTLFSSSWLEAGSSIAMRDFQFEISIHDFIHSQVYWDMNKILSTNYSLHICKMNAELTSLVKEITILYRKSLCKTPQKNLSEVMLRSLNFDWKYQLKFKSYTTSPYECCT